MIIFELTMPNKGSWNGQWTGESKRYVKAKPDRSIKKEVLDQIVDKSFYYNFGDGWGANISVRKVNNIEAKSIMKKSAGFCGYDWMISSIIKNQKIIIEK